MKNEFTTQTSRMHVGDWNFIVQAIDELGEDGSTFFREAALERAEKVLKKKAPQNPKPFRGGRGKETTLAAQAVGLTTAQFRKWSLACSTARALGKAEPKPESFKKL